MSSNNLSIPLEKVQVLDTIGNYRILKVPKKFVAPPQPKLREPKNLPVKKLKPATEKKLLARDKKIMRDHKLGKLKVLNSFSELFE